MRKAYQNDRLFLYNYFWHLLNPPLFIRVDGFAVRLGTHLAKGKETINLFQMKNQVISIYRQAERFAEITQKLLIAGNIPRVKRCLAVAEKLLITGSTETKGVISGIYVHSISTFMEFRGCRIAGLFPQLLQREYIKQINSTGV